ncbi:MAG: substrate-binding domain-containing protein [Chloroflexota bacterium]
MNSRKLLGAGVSAALLVGMLGGTVGAQSPAAGTAVTATPGQDLKMLLLPKFLGILPFDQANKGAQEAAAELQNPTNFDYDGPDQANSVAGQIDLVTNAPTKGYKVVMMSNNAGDQISPAAEAAQAAGTKVVTWDSPIPSAKGESLFVAQVDFTSIGQVMADMTLDIVGPDGGQVAILSASPDAANQNAWIAAYNAALAADPKYSKIEIVDTVYGNDQSEESYNQAQALLDKYPDLKLIMSPTSVGIVAASKALTDNGACDKVKVSGLGLPSEMKDYTLSGCAPEFALWSFVDLGYLTYYTSYLLGTGAIQGVAGETFKVGRPISGSDTFTIEKDPTRPDVDALRVLMGPFTVYNKDNVEAAAQ